jgi:hypothetical protein
VGFIALFWDWTGIWMGVGVDWLAGWEEQAFINIMDKKIRADKIDFFIGTFFINKMTQLRNKLGHFIDDRINQYTSISLSSLSREGSQHG